MVLEIQQNGVSVARRGRSFVELIIARVDGEGIEFSIEVDDMIHGG
jgi:hypothetical protein